MITNEQILKVLKNWSVYEASVVTKDMYGGQAEDHITITFKSPNDEHILAQFSDSWVNESGIKVYLMKEYRNGHVYTIYSGVISKNIFLEVRYLMTTAAKDYVSKQISNIFTDLAPVGLDALI